MSDREYTTDGFVFSYEVTALADICPRSRLHVDDWYPDAGAEWSLTCIADEDTGKDAEWYDVAKAWSLDSETQARSIVDGRIDKELGNG